MVSIYSVYAKGSEGTFKHIGDDTRPDIAQGAIEELKRQGYEVRVSITRIKREG